MEKNLPPIFCWFWIHLSLCERHSIFGTSSAGKQTVRDYFGHEHHCILTYCNMQQSPVDNQHSNRHYGTQIIHVPQGTSNYLHFINRLATFVITKDIHVFIFKTSTHPLNLWTNIIIICKKLLPWNNFNFVQYGEYDISLSCFAFIYFIQSFMYFFLSIQYAIKG